MNQPPTHMSSLFRGRHFDHTIIILCVRCYITYKLSYRDLVEMEPEVVIEGDFQDNQKTALYRVGYALRILRFKCVRTDKSTREADDITRLKRLYKQMHR